MNVEFIANNDKGLWDPPTKTIFFFKIGFFFLILIMVVIWCVLDHDSIIWIFGSKITEFDQKLLKLCFME
jgi:hypothetical protein